MMAAALSSRLGWMDAHDLARIERLFQRAGLPVYGPMLSVDRYLELMQNDKKVEGGKLRLVLLQQVGQAAVTDVAPLAEIRGAIADRCAHA
jgi:3-dehydroquinate synthase